jgi:hypothetical protein
VPLSVILQKPSGIEMSMDWCRLWHEFPHDPKWRTIARISGEPISLVQSVFIHLLIDASRNVTRGHVSVTEEDVASSLDVTDDQVKKILDAMQGRVLNGAELTGWSSRQVNKEDAGNPETGAMSATERKQKQRLNNKIRELEEKNQALIAQLNPAKDTENVTPCNDDVTPCHEVSRDVTTDKTRLDEIRDNNNSNELLSGTPDKKIVDDDNGQRKRASSTEKSPSYFEQFWQAYPARRRYGKKKCAEKWKRNKLDALVHEILGGLERWRQSADWQKDGGEYTKSPEAFLNGELWRDEPMSALEASNSKSPQLQKNSTNAENAWRSVLAKVKKFGRYGYENAELTEIEEKGLRAIGGWNGICDKADDFAKRKFIDAISS